ncbi:Prophage CP4-57 regulatory protein (AlpA) [compost metagenome]
MTEMVLLDFTSVSRKVGLSRKTIYCRIKTGDFPQQVKIGRASRWLQHEVDAWIAEAAAAR